MVEFASIREVFFQFSSRASWHKFG